MQHHGLVIVILSSALLSSCSWAKHRYQRIKSFIHRAPKTTAVQRIPRRAQPSAAQQAQARQYLLSLRQGVAAPGQALSYTEQLMLPDDPPPTTSTQASISTPIQSAPLPAGSLTLPTAPARVNHPPMGATFTPAPFIPREAPVLLQQQSDSAATPAEPGSALQRGLRSPSLPKTLPMDIDGKLMPPST